MKLSSISAGLAKMESKLIGSVESATTGNQSHQLIDEPRWPSVSPVVLMTRIIARTLLLITIIVCFVILLSVYMQSKWTNKCGLEYTSETSQLNPYYQSLNGEETEQPENDSPSSSLRRHIPISLRMSGSASDLMHNGLGEKGQVKCSIERKIANQMIASEPKKLQTPFGNITTDPRLIHLTGEKIVFSCRNADKHEKDEEEEEEEMDKQQQQQQQGKPEARIQRVIILARQRPNPMNDLAEKSDKINEKAKGENEPTKRNKRQIESLKDKHCSCNCAC